MKQYPVYLVDPNTEEAMASPLWLLRDEGKTLLRGDWLQTRTNACLSGMVHYFAGAGMYGIEICWQDETFIGRCWLLTENIFAEDIPVLKSRSWGRRQPMRTPLSVANYLKHMFVDEMEWPPKDSVSWTPDEKLNELSGWLKATAAYDDLKAIEESVVVPDDGPRQRQHINVTLGDGSVIRLDPERGLIVPRDGQFYTRVERHEETGNLVQHSYLLPSIIGHA